MVWIVVLFVLFLLGGAFAPTGNYNMPTRNLVIVEITEGKEIEKKVAEEADLFFSREMKTMALFGAGGITSYKASFTLNLQNVSGETLNNVSLIETVPGNIAGDARLIKSDSNFMVIEKEPIIKFDIGTIPKDGLKRISYSIQFGQEQLDTVTAAFKDMNVPIALIPIAANDCTGILCNDFNPCTIDYCKDGKCIYDNSMDGIACGNDLVCAQGKCSKSRNLETWLKVSAVLLAVAVIWAVLAFVSKKRKKMQK